METIADFISVLIHINVYLDVFVAQYGAWVYALLFVVVFFETAIVITPFLPGDTLLFAAGAIASRGGLEPVFLILIFLAAAILGDATNYWIGKFAGEQFLARFPKIVKPRYIQQTHAFFERYGGKTVVFARFIPFVRTIAPFLAGAGAMNYSRFTRYNITGAFVWVLIFVPAGYFFSSVPVVRDNFSLVLLAIIILSLILPVIEYVRERGKKNTIPPNGA